MTTVSVIDYGADPTGQADSTAAIAAACSATRSGDTILFPTVSDGLGYTIATYLVDPDRPWWIERKFVGERATNFHGRGPKIKARVPGTNLLNGTTAFVEVRGIDFDGDGKVTNAVRLDRSHNAYLEYVSARNATRGFLFEGCLAFGSRLTADSCGRGIVLRGANGTSLRDIIATNCDGAGLVIEGLLSGLTTLSGQCVITGGTVDVNCTSVDEGQIILDGVDSAMVSGLYVEGNSDGMRVVNGSHNCIVRDVRFLGGQPWRAVDIVKGHGCLFDGCSANITFASARILSKASSDYGSYENTFSHCLRLSSFDTGSWALLFEDSVSGTTYTATLARGGLAGVVPTVGHWRAGDRVGAYQCAVGGYPGTWISTEATGAVATVKASVTTARATIKGPITHDATPATLGDIARALDALKGQL